ncbi:FlxA-like family protein [Pseudomonas syringae]|uniref:FlxA-like family protein n=1 Tax=Pseudomonas syringae TaxID=317 RepID=UPI000404E827|nr:FlxA-like family protein [Pseudomonas syringae]
MTTINTSTLNSYSSSLTLAVKPTDAETTKAATAAAAATTTTETEKSSDQASTDDGKAGAAGGGGSVGGSSEASLNQTVEQIKQQIKDVQKQLVEQKAQLAAAQSGNGSAEEKAQKSMAIQGQISVISANLQTLQASLLQLETGGGVNTTA